MLRAICAAGLRRSRRSVVTTYASWVANDDITNTVVNRSSSPAPFPPPDSHCLRPWYVTVRSYASTRDGVGGPHVPRNDSVASQDVTVPNLEASKEQEAESSATEEEEAEGLASEQEVEDLVSEEEVEKLNSDKEVEELTSEEEFEKLSSDEEVEILSSDKEVEERASEEEFEKLRSDEEVEKLSSDKEVEERTSEEEFEKLSSDEEVEELTSEEEAEELVSEEEIEKLTSEEEVEEVVPQGELDEDEEKDTVDDYNDDSKDSDLTSVEESTAEEFQDSDSSDWVDTSNLPEDMKEMLRDDYKFDDTEDHYQADEAVELLTLEEVQEVLQGVRGKDVRVFEVHGRCEWTDTMVIATGNSDRHVCGIADALVYKIKKKEYIKTTHYPTVEGKTGGKWLIVDCGNIVIHVLNEEARAYYKLEDLWTGDLKPSTADQDFERMLVQAGLRSR